MHDPLNNLLVIFRWLIELMALFQNDCHCHHACNRSNRIFLRLRLQILHFLFLLLLPLLFGFQVLQGCLLALLELTFELRFAGKLLFLVFIQLVRFVLGFLLELLNLPELLLDILDPLIEALFVLAVRVLQLRVKIDFYRSLLLFASVFCSVFFTLVSALHFFTRISIIIKSREYIFKLQRSKIRCSKFQTTIYRDLNNQIIIHILN